ncbi:response regulator [Candidatus Woesearchaeota archaeon]|nr:response regulator [Candidatus Woesearchaeota archaeon]
MMAKESMAKQTKISESRNKPEKRIRDGSKRKKRILIVEDDEDTVRLYKQVLGDKYELKTVDTAKKALNQLKKDDFDLMILDIILPEESGEQFFARIKDMGDKRLKDIRVLFISVLGDVSEFAKKIDPKAGSLSKPFTKEDLALNIEEMMND